MKIFIELVVLLALTAGSSINAAEIVTGSGSRSGVYFQTARGALCRVISRSPGSDECQATETPGSVFNVANV